LSLTIQAFLEDQLVQLKFCYTLFAPIILFCSDVISLS
jgi:hypothetical protein